MSGAWPALRPYLVRAAAVSAALALAVAPLCALLVLLLDDDGEVTGPLLGLQVVAGLVGGALGVAVERRLAGRPLLAAALAALAVALAEQLVVLQAIYVTGVADQGGPGGGMRALGEVTEGALHDPGAVFGYAVGIGASLALPVLAVVALRLHGLAVWVQLLLGLLVTGAAAVVSWFAHQVGSTAAGIHPFSTQLAMYVQAHPVAGGALVALFAATVTLVVRGLPLAFALPLTLRLADRLEGPPAPAPAPEPPPHTPTG